ncbi:MAG: hypothetical protein ACK4TF_00895 [Thermodesulfovibrionales bacterium]
MAKKKVYVCQICNTYIVKKDDEAIPVCCGKEMVEMDEFEDGEVKSIKESSGGL